jgi:hypothetical protein
MSAHDTTCGQIPSTCALVLSITSNPHRELLFGTAVFSLVKVWGVMHQAAPSHHNPAWLGLPWLLINPENVAYETYVQIWDTCINKAVVEVETEQ